MVDQLTDLVGNNTIFWQEEEKRDGINEALTFLQCLTGELDIETFDINADGTTRYFAVPRQIALVSRVLYNGVALTPTSLVELDRAVAGWEDAVTGDPVYWAPIGISEVVLHPQPAVDGVVTIQGVSENTKLMSGGDALQLRDDDLVALLLYAHHYLTFKEGGVELNSTLDNVKRLVENGVAANDELLITKTYRKYEGLVKEESERPVRHGSQEYGVRKVQP